MLNTMVLDSERLRNTILDLPEVANWPQLCDIVQQGIMCSRPDWDLPVLACQALGTHSEKAIPAAVALVCQQCSIILVDDMLDQDPRGRYHQIGLGPTANLALALQSAALRVVGEAEIGASARAAVMTSLAQMGLATAYGQQLDVQNFADEENYWRVVQTKSTPFYATALYISAIFANAPLDVAERLYEIGRILGEMVQLYDDLKDALQTPANPDWQQGRNNLLIRYALTAEHDEREFFCTLLPDVAAPQVLANAQGILIRCGAVSYCAYHLIQRYRVGHRFLQEIPLADPAPLVDLLQRQIEPVIALLRKNHVEISADLGAST